MCSNKKVNKILLTSLEGLIVGHWDTPTAHSHCQTLSPSCFKEKLEYIRKNDKIYNLTKLLQDAIPFLKCKSYINLNKLYSRDKK